MQRNVGGVAVPAVHVAWPPLVDDVGVVIQALVEVVRGQPDRRVDGLFGDAGLGQVTFVDGPGGEAGRSLVAAG
jgi:hypothetical protein